MSKKAFDKIKEGLTEAIAVARGEAEPARFHVPEDIDVRAVRRRAAMSQEDFASAFGFTINQIRDWEQGRTRPIGGSARLSHDDRRRARQGAGFADAGAREGAAGGLRGGFSTRVDRFIAASPEPRQKPPT
jgi:putative transcriptional regulator